MPYFGRLQRLACVLGLCLLTPTVSAASHAHRHNHIHEERALEPVARAPAAGVFDPSARDNLVVYYGATYNTSATGLQDICADPNVDMVIMAFVYEFFGPGGYPSVNFGPGCSGQTPLQASKAPGLMDCRVLGTQIKQCQSMGKKILVSLGGSTSDSSFANVTQARQLASTLWDLFGYSTAGPVQLRPFGTAIVDGFDMDPEDHEPSYYANFVVALRKLYASRPSRQFYVSAAPQCPHPDASIPENAMHLCDFVFVQFYNNYCNLGTSYFQSIFQTWSNDFANGKPSPGPRLYIGAAASPASAGSGYIVPKQLPGIIAQAKKLNVPNLGGMSLWDGTNALYNIAPNGKNYLAVAKAAIQ